MIVRGRDFTDIYDLVGIRILVDSVRDCYAALGVMHATWQPVPGRFKDFIAMPKFNMYQSLHTTVIGPEGKPVELQIRTRPCTAPPSTASRRTGSTRRPKDDDRRRRARQRRRGHAVAAPAAGLAAGDAGAGGVPRVAALRPGLAARCSSSRPKGDVIALPSGSTPVDFAYAVHTEVGHRCIGARVNGRLVALESPLENGDTVEVFTSKSEGAGPSRDWLSFVASPRAKTKIRQWFAKERREDAIESGKDAISRAMRKAGLPLQRLLGGDALVTLARDLRYPDVTALYAAVGESHVSATSVVQKVVASLGGSEGAVEDIAETAVPARTGRRRPERRPGRRRQGRLGRVGQAGEVLHAGAG